MNYDFDELTPEVIRSVGFRERVRGYDPADVDPLLAAVARALDEIYEVLDRPDLANRGDLPPAGPSAEAVALAAWLHVGYAAREARQIVQETLGIDEVHVAPVDRSSSFAPRRRNAQRAAGQGAHLRRAPGASCDCRARNYGAGDGRAFVPFDGACPP